MNLRPHDTADAVDFNCMDFRREKLADPRRLSASAESHLIACTGCQSFSRRINEQERLLQDAVAVPVPEGLAERLMVGARSGTGSSAWRLGALAATVLLSLGIGAHLWHDYPRHDVAAFAVEHVLHEPESLNSTRLIEPARLAEVMANFGARVQTPLGRVRYVKLCPVPEGTGWHIVLDTDRGPATLLLVPTRHPGAAVITATLKGMGVHVEPGGQGYYAVVADSAERATAVSGLLRQRVDWSARAFQPRS